MKLLLDTHVWIWSLLDPSQLSRRVTKEMQSDENESWLSPISVWELMVLVQKGRIHLEMRPEEWIAEAFRMAPLSEAPLTREIAIESRRVKLGHEDPADRFIVATARVHDMTLVTSDERLLGWKGGRVLANR